MRIALATPIVLLLCTAIAEAQQKVGWTADQLTGPPNTRTAGDYPTAWASLQPDRGPEWIKLEFKRSVKIAEIRIRESFNPGAVAKVTAFSDDEEVILWEGNDPTTRSPTDFVIKPEIEIKSDIIKIYLDTRRKRGWNEIDAVELIAKDGTRQWVSKATASSSFGADIGGANFCYGVSSPLTKTLDKTVEIHLDGLVLKGKITELGWQFIALEDVSTNRVFLINRTQIKYISFLAESRKATATGVSSGPIASSGIPVSVKTELKIGQAVQVAWGDQWWAGKVLKLLPNGQLKIRYVGWDSTWDEIASRSRLQLYPKKGRQQGTKR